MLEEADVPVLADIFLKGGDYFPHENPFNKFHGLKILDIAHDQADNGQNSGGITTYPESTANGPVIGTKRYN